MTTPGAAGWYDDPDNSKALRYWDGEDWTARRKPKSAQQSPSRAPKPAPPPLPTSAAASPAPFSPPQQRAAATNKVTLGVIGAVALVVIGGFIAFKALSGGSEDHPASGTSGAIGGSGEDDEAEIKALTQLWSANFNNQNLAGLQSLMCSGSASQLPRTIFPRHDIRGSLSISVSNINVSGSRATASITDNWSGGSHDRADNTFAKESGGWKICHTLSY